MHESLSPKRTRRGKTCKIPPAHGKCMGTLSLRLPQRSTWRWAPHSRTARVSTACDLRVRKSLRPARRLATCATTRPSQQVRTPHPHLAHRRTTARVTHHLHTAGYDISFATSVNQSRVATHTWCRLSVDRLRAGTSIGSVDDVRTSTVQSPSEATHRPTMCSLSLSPVSPKREAIKPQRKIIGPG